MGSFTSQIFHTGKVCTSCYAFGPVSVFACRSLYSKNSTPPAFRGTLAQHKLRCSSESLKDRNRGYCLPKEISEALLDLTFQEDLCCTGPSLSSSAKDTDSFCLLPLPCFLNCFCLEYSLFFEKAKSLIILA